ncbi:MAG TPA: DUF177 domain-containing protein [Deltaproteobacteria bacterium]|nr:DUF177 domain-containing protein [Deltaproteobacteria bacterium]
MLIRIDEIPKAGLRVHLHRKPDWLKDFIEPDDVIAPELTKPLNVDLEITKEKQFFKVKGIEKGTFKLLCHRCGEAFEFILEEAFEFLLVGKEFSPKEEEHELTPEEMDYEFFDGEKIDVEKILVEQIFLAMPQKILCREDCKGLCPQCGANLNNETCNCSQLRINPMFRALANWKPSRSE